MNNVTLIYFELNTYNYNCDEKQFIVFRHICVIYNKRITIIVILIPHKTK